jgi:hypothetical protein
MLDQILEGAKISPEHRELYQLFAVSELGRKVFERMTIDTFMDEPKDTELSGVGFAFYDGRRSVLRDIHRVIMMINNIIKESQNGK